MKAQARHAHNYGHKFMNVTVHYLNVNLLQGNRRFSPPPSHTRNSFISYGGNKQLSLVIML